MHMCLQRNGNGYSISSMNYFGELGRHAANKQSVSNARNKLHWQAFEYLLHQANLERTGLPEDMQYKSMTVYAIDGSSFFLPRTPELLAVFTSRETGRPHKKAKTHYPYGKLVTAVNVYTGQPVSAQVDDHHVSERAMVLRMIRGFLPGTLSLLDRGLGGRSVFLQFEKLNQHYLNRTVTSGTRCARYVRDFLRSGKPEQLVSLEVEDPELERMVTIQVRLLRGPKDSEHKPIVILTNLLDRKRYGRKSLLRLYRKRWGVETLFNRVKNLIQLERFHARTYNGIMQEIFANLLILSLAATAVSAVIQKKKLDPERVLPNFKSAVETMRRHVHHVIGSRRGRRRLAARQLTKKILMEVARILYPIRPGRSYPRVSMQPIKSHNLAKVKKLREYRRSVRAR